MRVNMALLAAALGVVAPTVSAQRIDTTAVVSGQVTDTTGRPVPGAEVSVNGFAGGTSSDSSGRFRLERVLAGERLLTVRRLGFRSAAHPLSLRPGETRTVTVRLEPLAVPFDTVVSEAAAEEEHLRRTGFLARQRMGFGTFLTRAQIERMHVTDVWEVLRRVPLLEVVEPAPGRRLILMRSGTCRPQLYLDGMRTPDVEGVPASFVDGIEIYRHAGDIPAEFSMSGRACGAIVVWTR